MTETAPWWEARGWSSQPPPDDADLDTYAAWLRKQGQSHRDPERVRSEIQRLRRDRLFGIPSHDPALDEPEADPNREYLIVGRYFVADLGVKGYDREDTARFLRRTADFQEVERLPGIAARYRELAASLEEPDGPAWCDCRDLDPEGRRFLASMLGASYRRATVGPTENGVVLALRRLVEAAEHYAGPDPVKQAQRRHLWRNERAWRPYSSDEPFRVLPPR